MSEFLEKIKSLVHDGDVRVSEHGYDELADDGLSPREIVKGIDEAILIEDYPRYHKGPCVLVLQKDGSSASIMWCGAYPRAVRVLPCW